MKILISGVCGFVGSTLAKGLLENVSSREIIGLDNLSRDEDRGTFSVAAEKLSQIRFLFLPVVLEEARV